MSPRCAVACCAVQRFSPESIRQQNTTVSCGCAGAAAAQMPVHVIGSHILVQPETSTIVSSTIGCAGWQLQLLALSNAFCSCWLPIAMEFQQHMWCLLVGVRVCHMKPVRRACRVQGKVVCSAVLCTHLCGSWMERGRYLRKQLLCYR